MDNVRFGLAQANKACRLSPSASLPILCNGNDSYPTAPARIEAASGPMENLFSPDRYTTWDVPAGSYNVGSDVVVDLKIGGSTVTLHAIGFLFYRATTLSFPFNAYFYTAATSAYPAAEDWVLQSQRSLITLRDSVGMLSAPVSARWLRVRFENTKVGGGFSVGKLFAGQITDLGFLYARATETVVNPRISVAGYGDQPNIVRVGDPYRRFVLEYENVDPATLAIFRDSILAAAYASMPFLYLSPDGGCYECVTEEQEQGFDHVWSPPARYSFTFRCRSLP